MSDSTVANETQSDRPVTESAAGPEVAQLADEIAENLMSIGRGLGAKDGVIVEAALRAVAETAASKDDEVRELIKAWRVDWERRTHPAALDHSYDKHAVAFKPAEHPEHWCNRRDCDVAPRIAADGRALWNYGRHRTFTRILTTDYGTVAHVSVGREEDVGGPAERGAVYLVLSDQDAEIEEETFDVSLTADEADELAKALTSRARELRRLEQAESDAAAEAAVLARFPQLADGPAADPESA